MRKLMENLKYCKPWYHGSPYKLTAIRVGSTITQNIDIARIFSHKPTCVCIDDDGHIKHNGVIEGYLYVIDEFIGEKDVQPHPRTTMDEGVEWLIDRELKVRLIDATHIKEDEKFSDEEIKTLKDLGYIK